VTALPAPKTAWPRWAAWGFCLLIFAIICTDVALHPDKHNTTPTYRTASTAWWQGIDPYTQNAHAGFLYFPQAAFLFTPFNVLPYLTGEIVWRVFTFGLFIYALTRLNAFFLAARSAAPARTFLFLALLAVPSSFASLRNAQFDLPLAALVVLATAEVAAARWSTAALWLCLGVAFKPLAVVPLLLFSALYWKLIPRVAVGLLIVAAIPFLHWSPSYVAQEYRRCFETLAWASAGDEPRYSELAALLAHAGIIVPLPVRTVLRVIFALMYLGLGATAVRKLSLADSAWAVGALAADYLMLFNPRTETCSYVFLGPFVASLALYYSVLGHRWLARGLGFAAVGLACDAFPRLGTFSVHDLTDRWFKPLIAVLFLAALIVFIFRSRREKA
jgi:alpha-1,2-mannosyltransferase